MVTLKLIVNSAGILLNIIGAWMVAANSPKLFAVIDAGGAIDNHKQLEREIAHKNLMVKAGVIVLISGSVLQLISNFLDIHATD